MELKPLLVNNARQDEWLARFGELPHIRLTPRQVSDLELLGNGGYTPLPGFLKRDDYLSVVATMRLADGSPWSIPITLAVDKATAERLPQGEPVGLIGEDDQALAVLHLAEKYRGDKVAEVKAVYGTEDAAHPGVAAVYAQGDVYLGGAVEVLQLPQNGHFSVHRLTPTQTRAEFQRRQWRTVTAFQTRNPIHRAHEYIIKCALEIVDGALLHPIVGETKSDDIPADVRMRCYEILMLNYFPLDRILLAVNPAAMRYAGPREAIFHALVRRNYGCTHFIVGRDHAGVGNYYGTYDAHYIFDQFAPGELGITPLFFDHTFYCERCIGMASIKTCPHPVTDRINLSGTQVRKLLAEGQLPPPEFSRSEVARVLIEATRDRTQLPVA